MSYGIVPWHVNIAGVAGYRGAGIEKLAAWKKSLASEFERNDRYFAEEIRSGAPTLQQAVESILRDQVPTSGHGFQWIQALELLCRFHGVPMKNRAFYPASMSFIESFDAELASRGVPKEFQISTWIHRGPPIALPRPRDFPLVGYLRLEEVRNALKIVPHSRTVTLPKEFVPALTDYRDWLDTCDQMDHDLLAFYS